MSAEQLSRLRMRTGATLDEMAKRMGVALETYLELETGQKRFGRLYTNAFERVSLACAVEAKDPSLMSPNAMRQALRLSIIVLEQSRPTIAAAVEPEAE